MSVTISKTLDHIRRAKPIQYAAALAFMGSASAAQPHQCPHLPVTVAQASPRDAASICEGAGAAIRFFQSLRLAIPSTIHVRVEDVLPPACGPASVGCFVKSKGLVMLLPNSRFKEGEKSFRLPSNRHLYVSGATHEVAHALAAFNSAVRFPTVQAAEYVAYVTTLAAMDPATRTRVLKAYPQANSQGVIQLGFVLYMFEPMRFGVNSPPLP